MLAHDHDAVGPPRQSFQCASNMGRELLCARLGRSSDARAATVWRGRSEALSAMLLVLGDSRVVHICQLPPPPPIQLPLLPHIYFLPHLVPPTPRNAGASDRREERAGEGLSFNLPRRPRTRLPPSIPE